MHDRANPDIRRAVRSHWAQANHDSRPDTVFCSDLPAVFLDVRQSIIWEPDNHAGCTMQFAWCFLWPDVDGIGRAVSGARTFDRAWHRLQLCRHGVRWLCAVLRDLVD